MSESRVVIPEAAVEAAADAIIDAAYGQELPEAPEDLARAALEAAAPHMRFELQCMSLIDEME